MLIGNPAKSNTKDDMKISIVNPIYRCKIIEPFKLSLTGLAFFSVVGIFLMFEKLSLHLFVSEIRVSNNNEIIVSFIKTHRQKAPTFCFFQVFPKWHQFFTSRRHSTSEIFLKTEEHILKKTFKKHAKRRVTCQPWSLILFILDLMQVRCR